MLARVFAGRTAGFYVDVSAADPVNLSVTKWFYDLGWSGLNIEPIGWQLTVRAISIWIVARALVRANTDAEQRLEAMHKLERFIQERDAVIKQRDAVIS